MSRLRTALVDAAHATGFLLASDVAALALSLPTFYSWPGDRDTIEAYGEAFAKVGRHAERLREWERVEEPVPAR